MTFRMGVLVALACLSVGCAKGGNETDGVGGSTTTAGGMGGLGGAGGTGGEGGLGGQGGEPAPCDEMPCKLVAPQCGCAAGDRCTVTDQGLRVCSLEGTKQPLEYCVNDCTAGHYCYNNGGIGLGGICHQFCEQDSDCNTPTQGPGGICLYELNNGGGKLCSQNCDPVSNTGCRELNPGLKCDVARETVGQMRWLTRCVNTGSTAADQPCNNTSECTAGTSCVNTGGPSSLCLAWCEVGGQGCLQPNHSCVALEVNMQPIVIGGVQYGGCLEN